MSLGALETLFEAVSDKDKLGVQQCLDKRRRIEKQLTDYERQLTNADGQTGCLTDHAARWAHVAWIRHQMQTLRIELREIDQEVEQARKKLRVSFGKLIAIRAIQK